MSKPNWKFEPRGKIVPLPLEIEDRHTCFLPGVDEDGDKFQMVTIKFFREEGEPWEHRLAVNDDYQAFHSSKKTKNHKRVYIDILEVIDGFKHNGFGTKALSEFCAEMKTEGVEIVCLKAHPLIEYHWDMVTPGEWKRIKAERKLIHDFYQKNGFAFVKKDLDLMYKVI